MAAPNRARVTAGSDRRTEPFRVHARLIAEIGDELISADEIALYELIKNAFDAGSPWVRVDVVTPVAPAEVGPTIATLENDWEVDDLETSPLKALLQLDGVLEGVRAAISARDRDGLEAKLVDALKYASRIVIEDRGSGMDRPRLEEAFLSLATPLRLRQSGVGPGGRPVLGSKGLGRFSAKRLGRHLRVETAPRGSSLVHVLEIDWTQYDSDDDLFLEDLDNELWSEPNDRKLSGTRLIITRLNDAWTPEKLQDLAKSRVAQLMNPFFSNDFRIHVRLNGDPINLAQFQRSVLSRARLHVKGRVDPASDPPLTLAIWSEGKKQRLKVPPAEWELPTLSELRHVGPFDFELWEFDRTSRALGMVAKKTVIGDFIDTWGGGGPMLFRDGFRVFPYGQRPDDWLRLEESFFSGGGGSRLRTPAVVGYVAITSAKNANLVDLSNREGLRMTSAGSAFVGTMRRVVRIVNQEYRLIRPPKKDDAPAQLSAFRRSMEESISAAIDQVAEARESLARDPAASATVARLGDSVDTINTATRAFLALGDKLGGSVSASSYQSLLELAGLGMTSEHIAHEMSSLIDRSLGLLDQIGSSDLPPDLRLRLGQLRSNLDSIRGIVAYLTPLTQASRRRRIKIDVADELRTSASHYPALNNGVDFDLVVHAALNVRMNRGVLLQVFDNLITNSLYWLHERAPAHPRIRTVVDGEDQTVSVSDNGPGIDPQVGDLVFEPFMSMRRNGRGLGLFIARELLELETGTLELGPADNDGRLRTFVVNLQGPSQRDGGG
jgi:signal transduction histidine kinase